MTKILFICHGNICRSPMAEFVMKDLVERAGLAGEFYIESAATSAEEIGNPVYPPARRKLAQHGISCDGKTARRICRTDYEKYDLLIGMDGENLRAMGRLWEDRAGKLFRLLDFAAGPGEPLPALPRGCRVAGHPTIPLLPSEGGRLGRDVADPWYTGDFEATWQDVEAGCRGLLRALTQG